MNNNPKGSTTIIKIVSAIIFVIFVFSYVYYFQGGLLCMIQYAWSGGMTHYNVTVGAAIITVTAVAIAAVTAFFTRKLPERIFTLNYAPSLLLVGLMTAVERDGYNVCTSTLWLIATPLLIIAVFILMNTASQLSPFLVPLRSKGFLSQIWWSNLLMMVAMFALVFIMGNSNRTLHTRLDVERYCYEGDWDKALNVGMPQYDNDSSLTMLRALALANKGELPNALFSYEITGGSQSLFPNKDLSSSFIISDGYSLWQTIGKVPRNYSEPVIKFLKRQIAIDEADTLSVDSGNRIHRIRPVAKDYLLCGYLMDRNLKAFAQTLKKYYDINDSLPKHYKEAVLLYNNVCANAPLDSLKNNALATDFDDFLKLMRSTHDPIKRNSALRDAFFGTYWYYYYKPQNYQTTN